MIVKQEIRTTSAPLPIGQYSQAIRVGNLLFVAGQVGQNPKTGRVVTGSLEQEVRQTFDNIKAIIEEAGSSMDNVIRTLTFVKDLGIYDTFKKVRADYLASKSPPVNSFIQISDLQLGANIEIEAIALIPETNESKI